MSRDVVIAQVGVKLKRNSSIYGYYCPHRQMSSSAAIVPSGDCRKIVTIDRFSYHINI